MKCKLNEPQYNLTQEKHHQNLCFQFYIFLSSIFSASKQRFKETLKVKKNKNWTNPIIIEPKNQYIKISISNFDFISLHFLGNQTNSSINEKNRVWKKKQQNKPAPLDPTRRQRSPEWREREKSSIKGVEPGGGWPSIPGYVNFRPLISIIGSDFSLCFKPMFQKQRVSERERQRQSFMEVKLVS